MIDDAKEPPLPGARTGRPRAPFLLRDVEVRPASNEILVAGTIVRLQPRLMDVLLRLAADAGDVVSRETLLADVWPRRMVNDDVLSRTIADLRMALGDDAREARFIETLPKAGYRLVAPVAPMAPATAVAAVTPAVPATPAATLPTADSPAAPTAAAGPRGRGHHAAWRLAGALAVAIALTLMLVFRLPAPGVADRAQLERQLARAETFSSDPALETGPRFSPDGQLVAFAAGEGTRARIVVRGVRSTTRTVLGDPGELNVSPVFFPDGKRVAYFRRAASGDCGIVAQEIATGTIEPLVDCTRRPHQRFDIARDGRQLVYVGDIRPQFPRGLILRDIATGSERTLTAPEPDIGDDLYPRFAPDGARIVFFRGTESHRQAWLVDVAGAAAARNLDSPRGLAYGAAWLGPQGPLLVAADWFGHRALNLLDLGVGAASIVGARGARFPDVDSAGGIVYENAVYSANLFAVAPQAPVVAPREMWPSTRYTNQPAYSPDGSRVLFSSNRDGASGIFIAATDGPALRLPLPDDYIYLRPHWSADGRAIYAIRASRREDGARIQQAIRIAVPDGRVDVLTALGDDVYDVRDVDGGRTLIVGLVAGNAARVMRVPADGGVAERLPLPIASEYQVAGNRLALAQPQLSGLTLCDLATMKCEPLPLPISDGNRFDWLLTADAVWYRAAATVDELVRYDLVRRTVTWRGAFAPTAFGLAIAVRPDGGQVLVAREGPLAIDLMYAPPVSR